MTDLKIGNAIAKVNRDITRCLRIILWGTPGCGKTAYAYTAPKPILGIQFDNDGDASIKKSDDIFIIDLSGEDAEITTKFKNYNTTTFAQIRQFIEEKQIKTIVFDSCTTFGNKGLLYACKEGAKFSKGKEIITDENPGRTGYGIKNMLVNRIVMNMLVLANQTQTHLVIIAHEDLPDKTKDGEIIQQTLMLGSSLAFQIPVDFSEVWRMVDIQGLRTIEFRPHGFFKPMKTRMFDNTRDKSFKVTYNQNTGEGETLERLYKRWSDNGFNKLQVTR